MASPIPSDITLGTSQSIGKYFALVSLIPSFVLAVWVYVVLATGGYGGSPSLESVEESVRRHDPAQLIAVVALAFVVALVLHPLQFAMVQFLEGYWGSTVVGRKLQATLSARHLSRRTRASMLRGQLRRANSALNTDAMFDGTDHRGATAILRHGFELSEAQRVMDLYPDEPVHVMPTRLGNMLRRHEMRVGGAYRFPTLLAATQLGMVADPGHLSYLQDQRNQMDLAVRMTVCTALASAVTGLVMWPHGIWIMSALIPWAGSFASYRGATVSATHYGLALAAVADLNRFRLYDGLNLVRPTTVDAEREQNDMLRSFLSGADSYMAVYKNDATGLEPECPPQ